MSDPKKPTVGVNIHVDVDTIIESHTLAGHSGTEVLSIGEWVDIFIKDESQMRALTSAVDHARMRMYRRSNLVLARDWEREERGSRPGSLPESLTDDEVLSRYHDHREHMSRD